MFVHMEVNLMYSNDIKEQLVACVFLKKKLVLCTDHQQSPKRKFLLKTMKNYFCMVARSIIQ